MKPTTTTEQGFHHPAWARYSVYLFLPRDVREDLLGDLEEGFRKVAEEFGIREARNYYTFQVVSSIGWFIAQRIEQSRLMRTLLLLVLTGIAGKLLGAEKFIELLANILK